MTKMNWAGLGVILGSLGIASVASATTITVTGTEDTFQERDGVCSLREAVSVAASNTCHRDCGCASASDSFDTIKLSAGTTYYLTSGLTLNSNVKLVGVASNRPIIRAKGANSNFSGLTVNGGLTTLELTNFVLSNFGATALHLLANSSAFASGLIVRDNFLLGGGQTAAIVVEGDAFLDLSGSTVSNNKGNIKGGGLFIQTNGQASLTSSTVTGNEASQYGGGVFLGGFLYCSNSSITSNKANLHGGGIYAFGTAAFRLDNCVVQNNTSPDPAPVKDIYNAP